MSKAMPNLEFIRQLYLGSYGSCNKLPQTWLLKLTHIYYLTVLEVRIQNESHWAKIEVSARLCSFLKAPGAIPFPCFFQFLGASQIFCLVAPFHLQNHERLVESFSHCVTLTLTLMPLFQIFKGPLWLYLAHQNNLG